MYSDNTLTPKEAIRLCALGTLALKPMRYGELATSIRHFISRVIGPTPEIMGYSIELLKYEGLVETTEGSGDTASLRVTDAGRAALRDLLTANVRPANTELNSLITALKFRFLHLLPIEDQYNQAELLLAAVERELARLQDLREHSSGNEGFLADWLNHHTDTLTARLAWLTQFRDRLSTPEQSKAVADRPL
jgi:DNA-binding PadR family transcriptional regulator